MNTNRNYNIEFNNYLKTIDKENKPKLLMHVCCAPCSTTCLERTIDYFDITLYFYNPNITNKAEYDKRAEELKRYISIRYNDRVKLIIEEHHPEDYFNLVKGYEDVKEGGERCFLCYKQRLSKTAEYAKENGFDLFATTLTVSPYKNAGKLNEIGEALMNEKSIKYLVTDFKKENGYKRSIELSNEYGLYRQNFCGCIYSEEYYIKIKSNC